MSINPTYLGYCAAFCTTCAFIPQVFQTLKTKDTEAISLGMYSLFVTGVCLWLIYGILVQDLPLIAANIVTLSLASIVLSIKVRDTIAKNR